MAAYCVKSDVVQLLPANISRRIDDDNEFDKPIDDTAIDNYISNASDMVDAAISELYVTPLVKMVEVNRDTAVETIGYPKPIRLATAQLASAMIFEKLFSQDSDPNKIPEYSQQFRKDAYKILNDVRAGSIYLKGQVQTGWRYLRPESKNTNRLPIEFKEWDINKNS
jgi:hypothetical protein